MDRLPFSCRRVDCDDHHPNLPVSAVESTLQKGAGGSAGVGIGDRVQ